MIYSTKWVRMKKGSISKEERMKFKIFWKMRDCAEIDIQRMIGGTGKIKEGESLVLTPILLTRLIWDIDLIGLSLLDLVLEGKKERMKIMDGGMECHKPKREDLLVIGMIPVYPLVQNLMEIKILKSILEMTGRKVMEVSQERGMMLYLKMLQRSLSSSWLNKSPIWPIKSINRRKRSQKTWWL